MRAITTVLGGRHHGRRLVLGPGQTIRVGRTERADLVVPDDRMLSGVHFELAWDGRRCRLTDLGSATGTQLGGVPVSEAQLANGAWIRAGTTDFSVHFEGVTPSRRIDVHAAGYEPESAERAARRIAAHQTLRAANDAGILHAVLDGSRDHRVLELLRESVDEHQSLFDGAGAAPLAEVAPYLVRFEPTSRLLDALLLEGWSARWGLYLTSRRTFSEVRRQLRRHLMVTNDETGRRMYFRFYDPCALDAFLRVATPRQSAELFGEIDELLWEGRDGSLQRLPRPTHDQAGTP